MNERIRFAIIGTGKRSGYLYAPLLNTLKEDVESVGVGFFNWSSIAYNSALRWQRSTRFFAERGMASGDHLTTLTSDGKDPQPIAIKRYFHNVSGMETLTELVAVTSPEIVWRNPLRAYYMDDEMIAVADCLMSLVHAIREDKPPEYGPLQARLDQELTLAMNESANHSGTTIKLPLQQVN